MSRFMEQVRAGDGTTLWLDYVDYAAALLAGGTVPWLDTTGCAAWWRKAQGLLRSDVIALPVARVCAAWLDGHATLCEAMLARTRTVFPLKTLLADEALRAHLAELVRALRGSLPGPSFALACPSPRAWVAEAYQRVQGSGVDVGEDEADAGALYMADFLRCFGETAVDVMLLVESAESEPRDAGDVVCYRSALNVAAHYRWDAGLHVPGAKYAGGDAGLDFVIAPRALPGGAAGFVLSEAVWSGAAAQDPVPGHFRYATVPVGVDPERVLERLAMLR